MRPQRQGKDITPTLARHCSQRVFFFLACFGAADESKFVETAAETASATMDVADSSAALAKDGDDGNPTDVIVLGSGSICSPTSASETWAVIADTFDDEAETTADEITELAGGEFVGDETKLEIGSETSELGAPVGAACLRLTASL